MSLSHYYRKTALAAAAAAALTALFAAPQGVQAQTFDAAADYSRFNNPNGVWSAGYTNTLGSALVLYDVNNGVTDGLNAWRSSAIGVDPNFSKNLSGSTLINIAPGQVSLHPGPNNQYSVLRFTAPTTAAYNVVAQFFVGDTGDTDANILLNSNAAAPVFFAATTDTNPSFNQTVNLTAGNTLDFVVGSKGSYFSDTTPLNVTLTTVSAAAPEPSALALLALPLAGMVIRKRRKA
jgi:hypothetical protein